MIDGPVLVHGVPGCGKSTDLRSRYFAVAASTGWPLVIHDPALTKAWKDIQHVEALGEVTGAAFGRGVHVAFKNPDHVAPLCLAAMKCGRIILILDELCFVSNAHVAPKPLIELARTWRNCEVALGMGTQWINDCPTTVVAAVSRLRTGRCASPRILEYLRQSYGLDPEVVKALKRGEFLETILGFH